MSIGLCRGQLEELEVTVTIVGYAETGYKSMGDLISLDLGLCNVLQSASI